MVSSDMTDSCVRRRGPLGVDVPKAGRESEPRRSSTARGSERALNLHPFGLHVTPPPGNAGEAKRHDGACRVEAVRQPGVDAPTLSVSNARRVIAVCETTEGASAGSRLPLVISTPRR